MSVCGTLFRCTRRLGHLNRAGGPPYPGSISQHRLRGVLELRKRVRPFPGGEFSAEPQREIRRRCGGSVPRPAAGAKRKDNLRFSFLFELLPFPCFLIWRRFPICDRFEKGNGSRVTAACLS